MKGGNRSLHADQKPNRRQFLQQFACLASLAGLPPDQIGGKPAYFTVINHIHQAGVGFLFRHGFLRGKHYDHAYSIFHGIQETIDALEKWPWLMMCLEFDSYAYEAINAEDPVFVRDVLKPYVDSGRIDLVGGSYGQPYPEVVGWESNVRNFLEGRAVIKTLFDKRVECFIGEEIPFHPQMPQLLQLCGFRYASLEIQNAGRVRKINKSVVRWRGLDGTEIPTIPQNDLMIPVPKQYETFNDEISRSADFQEPLLTLWVEIWPPGGDWGASVLPYEKGFQSLRNAGVKPTGLHEYMRRRCNSHSDLDSEYLAMDDASLHFDVPTSKGGWGYEGDSLMKAQRHVEHSLRAAELLISIRPDEWKHEKLGDLWKKFMVSQNHDMFIVSNFPAEYNDVMATNLEAARMIHREVYNEITKLRKSAYDSLAGGNDSPPADYLIVQNATAQAALQPVRFEYAAEPRVDCALFDGNQQFVTQRILTTPTNAKPQFATLLPLAPYSTRSFRISRASGAAPGGRKSSGEITNEFYRVRWDSGASAFAVEDRGLGSNFLFRPFAGEITQVKETDWASPNTGENFRAKGFSQVSYVPDTEEAGPVYSALKVKGNILTLFTTADPAAWVTAQVVLYPGLKRVDFCSELNTNPQMGFSAFAELEVDKAYAAAYRDFPFGEEQSRREDFGALHYVRLQAPGKSLLVVHDGTQHYFIEDRGAGLVLRNRIARETLKGYYQWRWSVTTRGSLGAAESFHLAQTLFPAVVEVRNTPLAESGSLVTTADVTTVVFRFSRGRDKTTVWLVNYSGSMNRAVLDFLHPYVSVHRTDFEGNSGGGPPAVLAKGGRRVLVELRAWELAALELFE